jgi:predicted ATPase
MEKTQTSPLARISIEGFKSFRSLRNFTFNPGLNILIGPNGAGKSNFIDFFRMMENIALKNLAGFAMKQGRSENLLFQGASPARRVDAEFLVGNDGYRFSLEPAADGAFLTTLEESLRNGSSIWISREARRELSLADWKHLGGTHNNKLLLNETISSWRVFHFSDTSLSSSLRKPASIYDYKDFYSDGSNLPAYLWGLKNQHQQIFDDIVISMRLVVPNFDHFVLEPEESSTTQDRLVSLLWRKKGSNYLYKPWQMSDGTLRILALMTVLAQPNPPSTIVIDEPELGLHPNTLGFLAGLMHGASNRTQLIVATQSPDFLRTMEPDDVIIVNTRNGESTFERLERGPLACWLEDYSLGELWANNVIQAGPNNA